MVSNSIPLESVTALLIAFIYDRSLTVCRSWQGWYGIWHIYTLPVIMNQTIDFTSHWWLLHLICSSSPSKQVMSIKMHIACLTATITIGPLKEKLNQRPWCSLKGSKATAFLHHLSMRHESFHYQFYFQNNLQGSIHPLEHPSIPAMKCKV